MYLIDTNVFMYAVGRPHPLREPARTFFAACNRDRVPLVTSAEVVQELLHAYLGVGRTAMLDAALMLIERCEGDVCMHPPKTAGVFSLILSSGWLGAERSACDLAYAA